MKSEVEASKIKTKLNLKSRNSTTTEKREDRKSDANTVLIGLNMNKYYKVFKSHMIRLLLSNQSCVTKKVQVLDDQNKAGTSISEDELHFTFKYLITEITEVGSEFGSKSIFSEEKPDFVTLQKMNFLVTLTYNFRYLLILKIMVFHRKQKPIGEDYDFVYPTNPEDIEKNVSDQVQLDGFSLKKCEMIGKTFVNLVEDYVLYMRAKMVFPSNKEPTFKDNMYILGSGSVPDKLKFDGGIFSKRRLFKVDGIIEFSKFFFKTTNATKETTHNLCRELDGIIEEYQNLSLDMFKIRADNKDKKTFLGTNVDYDSTEVYEVYFPLPLAVPEEIPQQPPTEKEVEVTSLSVSGDASVSTPEVQEPPAKKPRLSPYKKE